MAALPYCIAAVTNAASANPSIFDPETWAPWLLTLRPWFLAAILLGGLVVAVLAWQDWRRNWLVLQAIRRLEMPPSAKLLDQELARLRDRDPAFDRALFQEEAAELFVAIQAARERGEPPPRHRVSDGVFRRAQIEREIDLAQGTRLFHGAAQLRQARLVGAFADPHFDALHVRFAWTSRPTDVPCALSLAEAQARASRTPEELHAEVWVFLRRPTAKTLTGRSAGDCPNCGAPYAGGAANLCTHCKAILNSGSYGWVLAQAMDYEVYRGPWRQFTGLEQMVARDSGFSPEAIEDRAALLFWRWLQARAARRIDAVQRLAAREMVEQLRKESEALKACKARRWMSRVSVAGVDLLLMELDSEEGRDEACLRVRWSAEVAEFPEDQRPRVPRSSFATVLTLVRDSGATTDVSTGVSSDRCHACKAASQDEEAGACSFCGASRAPGVHDFVLADARSFEDWMARRQEQATMSAAVEQFLPSFKFVDERLRLLQLMASMARADGRVTRSERALLKGCCRRWGIDFASVRPVLDGQAPPPEVILEPGSWPARAFLEGLCEAAAIDGVIDATERALLARVAKRLGLEPPTHASLKARADAVVRAMRQAGASED